MARDYFRKRSTWWTGETGRALRNHPSVVREVGDYLISAPTANVYGLYYLPVLTIVNDTGRQQRQVEDCIRVLHDLCFAYYDPINQFVWVREMCREQLFPLPLRTGDWQIRAAQKWYYSCQANLFLGPWFDHYAELVRIDGQRRHWVPPGQDTLFDSAVTTSQGSRPEAPSKGQVRTTTTVRTKPDGRISTELGASFDRFWQAWPDIRKVGKKEARLEWDRLRPDATLTDAIIAALDVQRTSSDWLRDGGRYIPHPSRYLKNHRWEDRIEGPRLSDSTVAAGTAVAEFLRGERT